MDTLLDLTTDKRTHLVSSHYRENTVVLYSVLVKKYIKNIIVPSDTVQGCLLQI